MKSLSQVLSENGHEADVAEIIPGVFVSTCSFEQTREFAVESGRTPVSAHMNRRGEWLATLRLEDLLVMIPNGYGVPEEVE